MFGIFVIGSIRSTEPMDTSGIQRAQATWAHFWPDFVDFMAPPAEIKLKWLNFRYLCGVEGGRKVIGDIKKPFNMQVGRWTGMKVVLLLIFISKL